MGRGGARRRVSASRVRRSSRSRSLLPGMLDVRRVRGPLPQRRTSPSGGRNVLHGLTRARTSIQSADRSAGTQRARRSRSRNVVRSPSRRLPSFSRGPPRHPPRWCPWRRTEVGAHLEVLSRTDDGVRPLRAAAAAEPSTAAAAGSAPTGAPRAPPIEHPGEGAGCRHSRTDPVPPLAWMTGAGGAAGASIARNSAARPRITSSGFARERRPGRVQQRDLIHGGALFLGSEPG